MMQSPMQRDPRHAEGLSSALHQAVLQFRRPKSTSHSFRRISTTMALPPKFAGQMVATAGAEVKHTLEICTSPSSLPVEPLLHRSAW